MFKKQKHLPQIVSVLLIIGFAIAAFISSQVTPFAARAAVHPPTPPTGRHVSVVLVHGFNGGDGLSGSGVNGGSNGNCSTYWNDTKTFLHNYWLGDIRTVQYYSNESNCNSNGNEQYYSANLHDEKYASNCRSYYSGNEGSNNEHVEHVSCLFAWYLYYNFGQRGWEVELVGHSMGGLIIRSALYEVQLKNPNYPSSIGHVLDVVTFNTPHGGIGPSANLLGCGGCVQMQDMGSGSDFMNELDSALGHAPGTVPMAPAPQTPDGTIWTVIGSYCDNLVGDSALELRANHKVRFEYYPQTCYDHSGALHDESLDFNSAEQDCDTQDPDNNCGYIIEGGDGWHDTNNGAHGLETLLIALNE